MLNLNFLQNNFKKCRFLYLVTIIFLASAGFALWTNVSIGAKREFAEADNFPRGALVYAQFQDLPALLKLWDESDLKKRYLASENFKQFQNRHLALKLVSRFKEFNAALGLGDNLDLETIAGAAESRAAVAVYDIEKLEFVFVAPLSPEKFAATMFYQQHEQFQNFEETTLEDNTIYYRQEVDADRSRQKQKILFAHSNGQFVLATSENLFLRTLANINHKTRKDRLSDEPSFQALATKFVPHLATVWVDQSKLNTDWYFKHYWIMRNIDELESIRAGIFDFEMQENKLIERREFLLTKQESSKFSKTSSKISIDNAIGLQKLVPANVPFYKLQAIENVALQTTELIEKTILDRLPPSEPSTTAERWDSYDSFAGSIVEDYSNDYNRYASLGNKYDLSIDESDDKQTVERTKNNFLDGREKELESELGKIVAGAKPTAAVFLANPQSLEKPFFVEFQKAVVFTLRSTANLDQKALENQFSAVMQNRIKVSGQKIELAWKDLNESNIQFRQLILPTINREICYAIESNQLIVANNADLLKSIIGSNNQKQELEQLASGSFDDLTMIRLDRRKQAFDKVMNLLSLEEAKNGRQTNHYADRANQYYPANDFFAGNVSSLLETLGQTARIQVKRNRLSNRLQEEVEFIFERQN